MPCFHDNRTPLTSTLCQDRSTEYSDMAASSSSLLFIHRIFEVWWLFTESDFFTFVIPNTLFGCLGSLAAHPLSDNAWSNFEDVFRRLPIVVLFNWANVFIFDLANQRSPGSVAEDRINKPWRPIPRDKINSEQCRQLLLVAVPFTLWLNYHLNVWEQGLLIHVVTWMYNDLRGMDDLFVREILISVGYAMFNTGSLKIAQGGGTVNSRGIVWVGIVSAVILTTMQVQDLKDQEGDRLRGRKTVVLRLGEQVSRTSIAIFTVFWTLVCVTFWIPRAQIWAATVPGVPGMVVVSHVLLRRTQYDGRLTWKLWCVWLVSLYSLPSILGIL